jgi:ABC-type branched-subunit amino acid transport system ATPase component
MSNHQAHYTDPYLIAFLFQDVGRQIRAINLAPEFVVTQNGPREFDIARRDQALPTGFFSPSISSITALVGRNSSGKSTVLADIARILGGNKPVTERYALIIQEGDQLYQLTGGGRIGVTFGGAGIADGNTRRMEHLKVVYFSSTYDPLQRKNALVKPGTGVNFIDISNQYIYSRNNRGGDDFDDRLRYLRHLNGGDIAALELSAENKRTRTIEFKAALAAEPHQSARIVLDFLLNSAPDSAAQRRLFEELRTALRMSVREFGSAMQSDGNRRSLLLSPSWSAFFDFFNFLRDFLSRELNEPRLTEDGTVFLIAIGKLSAMLEDTKRSWNKQGVIERLADLFADPAAVLAALFGDSFFLHAATIAEHAKTDEAPMERAKFDFTIRRYIVVAVKGKPIGTSKKAQAAEQQNRMLMNSFMTLRSNGVEFDVEFTGLSDGQRSLLSFASRYFAQEDSKPWDGNTLLLIDEHEQGLHPEWQRHFVRQLCHMVKTLGRTDGWTQIVLSSHSPFVVSDLPKSCVNIVGGENDTDERTFGANLMELLLSPLFMERTTGEFAAEKVKGWLERIAAAPDTGSVEDMRPLIDLVGDKLLRGYLNMALNERLAKLKHQGEGRSHD